MPGHEEYTLASRASVAAFRSPSWESSLCVAYSSTALEIRAELSELKHVLVLGGLAGWGGGGGGGGGRVVHCPMLGDLENSTLIQTLVSMGALLSPKKHLDTLLDYLVI